MHNPTPHAEAPRTDYRTALSLRVLVLMKQPNKLDGADQEDKKPIVHEMDDIDANPYAYTARERDIQSGLALVLSRTASALSGSDASVKRVRARTSQASDREQEGAAAARF